MDFLFIKGDRPHDVRMAKYIRRLSAIGHKVSFWGWDRLSKGETMKGLVECRYLYKGGGFRNRVWLRYPIWMFRLFFAMLFSRQLKGKEIIAENFDSAFPVCIACWIRGLAFSYEILDEFAISYKFPTFVKWLLTKIDHWIIRKAKLIIHVDSNRITYASEKSVVIENSPEDYWEGKQRSYQNMARKFAVVGCLSAGRGLFSICDFAARNPNVSVLIVGNLCDDKVKQRVSELSNAQCYDFMPQGELFKLMESCCGVFSLYEPTLEINRLAASNKVYDAMMMGIPVITNKEVINSRFIEDQGVGIVVDYNCNETWDQLVAEDYLSRAVSIGRKGRRLYLDEYQFDVMLAKRFIPAIEARR